MDNGYIIDEPKYNTTSYLYDVSIITDTNKTKIISCYRILNSTTLIYAEEPGYFYISMDNKYIYFKDTAIITEVLKNINFSINNPDKTNQDILEINNDPVQKYTYIILSVVPESICINLALEDNNVDRLNQITQVGKYNSYDCMVKNMTNNNFTNIEDKKNTLYERLTSIFTQTPTATASANATIENDIDINIVDIHAYNKFYVYGLTSLNLLLIVLIVIMLLMITNEPGEKRPRKLK
jgi:hypothetical protein